MTFPSLLLFGQLRLGDMNVKVSNQHQTFAGAKFTKGKLILLPLGSLQVLTVDKVQKHHCIMTCTSSPNVRYLVQPWKCDFSKKSGLFCPYWMVKEGPNADESCLQKHSIKVGTLTIPCFTNKKVVEKGTPLLVEPAEEQGAKKKKVAT